MQLSELSRRSGVSAASIKYYLREGLLPPGVTVSARKAEYDEDHLRRLRLIRALLTVGGMSVAQARDVLAASHDPAFDRHTRLGVAQYLLPPHVTAPPEDTPEGATWRERRGEVLTLLRDDLGWQIHDGAPALDALTEALTTLDSLGYATATASLRDYAVALRPIAEKELAIVDEHPAIDEAIEAVVAHTVLYEPVLLSLRRLAHEDVSARLHPPA
ncbi:MerR family transcriptional regulator [Streptacidiphilus neutrinimicus]|uniref:MerR family transcriptional regulator n=1 Tax=Streptacidiphilus neutrinimicus TaxID=105420 RepID=UPI0005A912FF|nr:MerR family transcriptional regulator [Streptacidiphilus neutrinimicus]